MATFKDVILKALTEDKMSLISVNQNLMKVSRSQGKKPAHMQMAVTDELAQGMMRRSRIAFVLHIDGDEIDKIVEELKDIDTTESA